MKKYFLLATTALLLGTSNVIAAGHDPDAAAGGSVSTTMTVNGTILSAPTVEVLDDVNWGTIYLSEQNQTGVMPLIASFGVEGFQTDGIYTINGYTGQIQGKIKVSNLPAGATISVDSTITLDTVTMLDNEFVEGNADGEYLLISNLYANDVNILPTGEISGSFPINITY